MLAGDRRIGRQGSVAPQAGAIYGWVGAPLLPGGRNNQKGSRRPCDPQVTVERKMRMMPVKTKPTFRRLWVKFPMWGIGLRMRVLHGDPDVWFTVSHEPTDGSPWGQTRAYSSGAAPVGPTSVRYIAEAETRLRLDAVHDYFVALRTAMAGRRVYSLYVMCRSTIEACAFATWVFDPEAEPSERLLRGLMLGEHSLKNRLQSLRRFDRLCPGEMDSAYLSDVARATSDVEARLGEIKRAVEAIRADIAPTTGPGGERSLTVPSPTRRISEMLVEDIGMPQGWDAYHRLSGVAHSEGLAIFDTWSIDGRKPSIDYYSLLVYLHLALCSVAFSLGRRAACWGEPHKSAGLEKIIKRIERVIEGELGVRLL